jgi:glycosyltransferase involved in cell wall biosynthesis
LTTAAIVSVAESDRQRLIGWGIPAHKIVVVPNGIDLSRFQGPVDRGRLRQALGLESDCPLVMQVGRLSAQKDPLAFVEGAWQVLHDYPAAHLAMIGEGPLEQDVQARIGQLGLEGQVHLLGWRDEAHRYMAAADVVTLTSRWEGLPYVLLEAMAWSRPVVATAVNGCPEIVAEGVTGFLTPPGDTAAWAARVIELFQDPARASAMGRRGRERVEELYALPAMVAQIEALYRRLASPKK